MRTTEHPRFRAPGTEKTSAIRLETHRSGRAAGLGDAQTRVHRCVAAHSWNSERLPAAGDRSGPARRPTLALGTRKTARFAAISANRDGCGVPRAPTRPIAETNTALSERNVTRRDGGARG